MKQTETHTENQTEKIVPGIHTELDAFREKELQRLKLDGEERQQWTEGRERPFTKEQRAFTTVLVSGLTVAHDVLLQATMIGMGYKVEVMDTPNNEALRVGKEFGNRGQCNPTYFTVGNLISYLQDLRDNKGLSTKEIIENYLYVTAGGCGPCRFSMYITEYRKALRDSGFEGFRIMAASQTEGAGQTIGKGDGLEIGARFFVKILMSFLLGDVLNALMYHIRPYEIQEGDTDKAVENSRAYLAEAMGGKASLIKAIWKVRKEMGAVKVDRSRVKPKVSIIGEFWAMTTEGDGNYKLQRFLESEGAEVDIQLMINWILYINWEMGHDSRRRANLKGADGGPRGLAGTHIGLKIFAHWAADKVARGVFYGIGRVMGLKHYKIPDFIKLAEIAQKYYDNDVRGGEGHQEVAKLITNVVDKKADMTISVKPFGCMPSSGVSDGVQSLVTERYPEAVFLPIETSGDGAVNVYGRIQMQLFKAKQAAKKEFLLALATYGLTEEEFKTQLKKTPKLNKAFYAAPHKVANTGANTVHALARHIGRKPTSPLAKLTA